MFSSRWAYLIFRMKNIITKPSVSVLIPAFESQKFICETLDSLNKQVFQDFQLLISIDKSNDDTEFIIKKWCQEHKNISAQIFCQAHRLGWVKNINFLLEKCQTKYFMVLPHDDLLHETYLKKMVQCLLVNPQACTAFSDIQGFGTMMPIITESSIKGERFERVLNFLFTYCGALAFRGLVNREVLSDLLLLSENDCSNFAIDTLWNLQMVLKGELIRVPEVLYRKRYVDGSVHDQWGEFRKEDKINAWLEHCKDCLKIIFSARFKQLELMSLIAASKSRLLQEVTPLCTYPELLSLNEEERDLLVKRLRKIISEFEKENKPISQISDREHI